MTAADNHGPISVEVYSRYRIRMCGKRLHTFSYAFHQKEQQRLAPIFLAALLTKCRIVQRTFLDVPNLDTLVKRTRNDQIRLRVVIHAEHVIRMTSQDLYCL